MSAGEYYDLSKLSNCWINQSPLTSVGNSLLGSYQAGIGGLSGQGQLEQTTWTIPSYYDYGYNYYWPYYQRPYGTCPNCGHCPNCGRHNHSAQETSLDQARTAYYEKLAEYQAKSK
jgi:hypothetical protein